MTFSLGESAPSLSSSASPTASTSDVTIGPDDVRPSTAPLVLLQSLPTLEPSVQHFDTESRLALQYAQGLVAAGARP